MKPTNRVSTPPRLVATPHVFKELPDWRHEPAETLADAANIFEVWASQLRQHIKDQVKPVTNN